MIRRRFLGRPAAALFVGLLMVVASVVLVASVVASSKSACVSCHKKQQAGLARNAHADVTCAECHQADGAEGLVDMRVRVLGMLAIDLPNSPPAAASVDSRRCLKCHPRISNGIVTSNGIRMSHREPLAAGQQCVDCHGDAAHGPTSESHARANMEDCVRCHTVSALSADCRKCHEGSVSRETRLRKGSFSKTHGTDWRRLHGMGNLQTCSACHTAARCRGCHGVSLPHEANWLNVHGPEVSKRCAQCHDTSTFCVGCHGLRMPHPVGFRKGHSSIARKTGRKVCSRCHENSGCDACHTRHAHPGLDPTKAARLRKKAGI